MKIAKSSLQAAGGSLNPVNSAVDEAPSASSNCGSPISGLTNTTARRRWENWAKARAVADGRPISEAKETAVKLTRSDSKTISARILLQLRTREVAKGACRSSLG